MNTRERDMRRWSAYERLAADSSASESERKQARERLDALRQRYPNGRPRAQRQEWRFTGRRTWNGGYGEYDPDAERRAAEARAEQERQVREAAVRQQRAWVEAVPRWETSTTLWELYRSRSPWSEDEHRMFKAQRVRLTGSSRAADL